MLQASSYHRMTLIYNQSTRSPRRRNFKPNLRTQTNKPRGDTELDWFICFQTCELDGTVLNVRRKRKDQDLGGNRTPMLPPKWTVKVKEICYTEQNQEPQKYENRDHLKAEDLQVRREWDWSQLFDKSDWNRAMGQAFCLSSEDDGQCRLRRRVWKWKFLDARRMVRSLRQRLPGGDRNFERLMCAYKLG